MHKLSNWSVCSVCHLLTFEGVTTILGVVFKFFYFLTKIKLFAVCNESDVNVNIKKQCFCNSSVV